MLGAYYLGRNHMFNLFDSGHPLFQFRDNLNHTSKRLIKMINQLSAAPMHALVPKIFLAAP